MWRAFPACRGAGAFSGTPAGADLVATPLKDTGGVLKKQLNLGIAHWGLGLPHPLGTMGFQKEKSRIFFFKDWTPAPI